MRRLPQSGLVVALVALAACARCGAAAGPPPERFVPADVLSAVVVPQLRGAARSLSEFYSTASDFPGTSRLPALRADLSAQLGFDPLDLRSMRDAGIEPRGGLALAFLPPARRQPASLDPPALLVLPISNRAAAEGLFRRIAAERLGAAERTIETVGAVQVVVYRPRADAPAALAVGDGERYFFVSPGPAGPAAVARALALPAKDSLGATPAWQLALRAAGEEPAAVALVPPGSPLLGGLAALRDGVSLSVSAAPGRLRARAALLLGDREPSFRALAGEGNGGTLAARLDPASALVARWDGDPAALGAKLAPLISAPDRTRLERAGIDLRRDLFGALAPGSAAAASLAPRIDLPTIDAESLRRDPLRLLQFEAVLPVRDAARLPPLSDRIVRLTGQRARGAPWSIPTASGEVAWAIEGGRLLVAGGAKGRLAALRQRLGEPAGGYRPPTDVARKVLAAGGLGAMVLDTRNFAASVRALPFAAFGTGPTGFVMRSLVNRFVDPAERIDAAALRVELAPGALVLALDVEPRTAEASSP